MKGNKIGCWKMHAHIRFKENHSENLVSEKPTPQIDTEWIIERKQFHSVNLEKKKKRKQKGKQNVKHVLAEFSECKLFHVCIFYYARFYERNIISYKFKGELKDISISAALYIIFILCQILRC